MVPVCHPALAKPDVERWTLGDTRQWAESVVGLSALDASRVAFCVAQLSTYPTPDLLEDLGEAGLGAAAALQLVFAAKAGLWTKVRDACGVM